MILYQGEMFSMYLCSWRSSYSINILLGKTLISCLHYPNTRKRVVNFDKATDIEDLTILILLNKTNTNTIQYFSVVMW